MAKKQNYYQKATGNMISAGIGNMVGIGLIGGTASMANALPAGMAHDVAGMVPGLQSVALMGPNVKLINDNFSNGFSSSKRKVNHKRRK
jgi:hypothetical protein